MEIFNYDNNGFYIGKSTADESPLEKGVFLVPANATTSKPPINKEGFDIKFNVEKNSFEYVEKIEAANEEEKIEEPSTFENNVPTKISRLQAKLQLLEIGLLDEVQELVKQDRKVEIYWMDTQSIERSHPILNQMAIALGLTSEQLDNLFIEASRLS